jgi:hypothetical protein
MTNFRKLSDAIYDTHQQFANLNDYYNNKYPAADMAGAWWEIDQNTFNYFLEVLPPYYVRFGFISSEFLTGSITSYYINLGEKYYCAYIDWKEKDAGLYNIISVIKKSETPSLTS